MKKHHSAQLCAIALIMAALSAGVAAKCAEPERMEAPARNNATQAVRTCENDTQAEPSDPIPYREDVSILFYAEEIETEWAELHPAETDSPEKITTYWEEIPLSADVQAYIVEHCAEMDISPAVIFAMIKRESTYNPDAIGDQGRAQGLMQIQCRWHEARMERLGVTNLLDPVQNVSVGMDYLAELLDIGNGLEWALIYYNAGGKAAKQYLADGVLTDYAKIVLNEAERIEANVLHR